MTEGITDFSAIAGCCREGEEANSIFTRGYDVASRFYNISLFSSFQLLNRFRFLNHIFGQEMIFIRLT